MADNRKHIEQEIKDRGDLTPLDLLLNVMNNPNCIAAIRIDAAKAAAPYVHKKQPIDMNSISEIKLIQPYIPSREELAQDYQHEIDAYKNGTLFNEDGSMNEIDDPNDLSDL